MSYNNYHPHMSEEEISFVRRFCIAVYKLKELNRIVPVKGFLKNQGIRANFAEDNFSYWYDTFKHHLSWAYNGDYEYLKFRDIFFQVKPKSIKTYLQNPLTKQRAPAKMFEGGYGPWGSPPDKWLLGSEDSGLDGGSIPKDTYLKILERLETACNQAEMKAKPKERREKISAIRFLQSLFKRNTIE